MNNMVEWATARFTASGDGRTHGNDRHDGTLAAMTLYAARALIPVGRLLGAGPLLELCLEGVDKVFVVAVRHDGDFGTEVAGTLTRSARSQEAIVERPKVGSVAVEVRYLLNAVSEMDLVAGCLLVSVSGKVVAEQLPGIAPDLTSGIAEKITTAYDSLTPFVGVTSLSCSFEWIRLVATPAADSILVVVADLDADVDDIVRTARLAGAGLTHVDLDAWNDEMLGAERPSQR